MSYYDAMFELEPTGTDLISISVNFSCALCQIMTRYDMLKLDE